MSRPSTAVSTAGSSPFIIGATTTTIISSPSKRRGSILVAASGALSSLSFSRRKKPTPLSRAPSGNPHSNNHPPIVFSEVIEISAESVRKAKEEEAEMERLRDAAAQTLGLSSVLMEDEPFTKKGEVKNGEDDVQVGVIAPARRGRENLLHDEDEDDGYMDDERPAESDLNGLGLLVPVTPTLSTPTQSISPHLPLTPTRTSYQQPQPPASPTSTLPLSISANRARSGSHSHSRSLGHARHSSSNSISRSLTPLPPPSSSPVTSLPTMTVGTTASGISGSPTKSYTTNLTNHNHHTHTTFSQHSPSSSSSSSAPMPAFPTTLESLKPFISLSGTFPKHYHSSTLLKFAFGTKQWKMRYVVLTTPSQSGSPTTPTANMNGRPSTASSSNGSAQGGMERFKTNAPPSPSYLHLFKNSSSGAVEMERLEINEDSVVFIADSSPQDASSSSVSPTSSSPASSSSGHAGSGRRSHDGSPSSYAAAGKKGVIQIGGVDVGLHIVTGSEKNKQKERESVGDVDGGSGAYGRTMWLLQITDSEEARKWIAAIKGVVLSQRSQRAGLPHNAIGSFFEPPRGDLDVMLSMRAQQASFSSSQSLMSTSSNDHMGTITPRVQSPVQSLYHGTDSSGLSPPSSLSRSHSKGNLNPSRSGAGGGAVSALKGLFTSASTRPRSPSSASTLSTGTFQDSAGSSNSNSLDVVSPAKPPMEEPSFGSAGTNLLMLRSNSISSTNGPGGSGLGSPTSSVFSPMTPPTPITATANSTTAGPSKLSELLLDRRILPDEERHSADEPSFARNLLTVGDESLRTFGSPSLQPPPRRRAWTSSGIMSPSRGSIPSPGGPGSAITPPTSAVAAISISEMDEGSGRSATPPPMYSYAHANGSTAESFGIGLPPRSSASSNTNGAISFSGSGQSNNASSLPSPSTDGSRSRARMSWSSASSFASNDPTSSPETNGLSLGSRRWSRHNSFQNPMLTPPNGSPPNVSPLSPSPPSHPHRLSGIRHHPYLAEHPSPASRSSSVQSSPPSLILDLRPLSPKRTSGSSVQSFNSTGTTQSRTATSPSIGMANRMFRRNSHRISVPPPQRPVPISALPPTPQGDEALSSASSPASTPPQVSSAPPTKSTFREILTSRSHRLSLQPPIQPPPAGGLPPRPDEGVFKPMHRKSLSNGSVTMGLYSIPASPALGSPHPPPNGPLPPPPSVALTNPTPTSILPSSSLESQPASNARQSKSFVRRIRILSAPSTSPPSEPIPPPPSGLDDDCPRPMSTMPSDVPSTPIGEPITTFQEALDIASDSPIIPPPPRSLPLPMNSPPPEVSSLDDAPGITSLSPPPRRGSRRIATPDKEELSHEVVRLSSMVTLKDVRRSHEENRTPPPIPSPLPPSPLSPYHSESISSQPYEPLDHSVDPDNATISTVSSPHSPVFRSSPGHSAVSLIDVSI
ncbi:hypothetical protein QCA50_007012 [Cerrena zonata]|uniref:PH domain-containing protein n=1 Tax=Cerrena zonata TaxID=2478898 RepID=A0AAW0GMJ2_9APHY